MSGPALQGASAKGKGVVGQTKSNSTSTTNEQAGVWGQDLSTSGTLDAGVRGFSNNGTGIDGYSNHGTGVKASSSASANNFEVALTATGSTGIYASGTGYGIYASGSDGLFSYSGSVAAVEAQNSTTSTAFYANGLGGLLFACDSNILQSQVFVVADLCLIVLAGSNS